MVSSEQLSHEAHAVYRMASVNVQLLFKLLLTGCVSGGKEALPIISYCVENIESLFLPPLVTLEPAAESLVVCPGDTANYVCTDEGNIVINWQICCRNISSDSCSTETTETLTASMKNFHNNRTYCGVLFTYDYAQGVSDMNITIPLAANTALLEITCHFTISRRVLRVAGEVE